MGLKVAGVSLRVRIRLIRVVKQFVEGVIWQGLKVLFVAREEFIPHFVDVLSRVPMKASLVLPEFSAILRHLHIQIRLIVIVEATISLWISGLTWLEPSLHLK
jgi:hypothetical protein